VNDSVGALFPSASSFAFAYVPDSGYVTSDRVEHGRGYWLRFPSLESIELSGVPLTNDTIGVKSGWNLIGSISAPVPVSSVVSKHGGLVTGNFFGYENGYKIADSILPGKGYWVRVSADDSLIFSAGDGSISASRIRIVPTAELPPPPPDEAITSQKALPNDYALEQAYPSPFNPTTTIRYQLPLDSRVTLTVYNVLGEVVGVLKDEVQGAGYKSVVWNASSGVASGMYFYRLEATALTDPSKTFTQVRKVLFLK